MPTPAALSDATVAQLRIRSLGFLAPAFRAAVVRICERMEGEGHDPYVIETLRLPQLQAEYFRRKTSRQQDVLRSMHGHGLAVDIVSASKLWQAAPEFWKALERAVAAEQQTWGGKWKNPVDPPHVQWGGIAGAVPDALVAAYNRGGLYSSWQEAKAL